MNTTVTEMIAAIVFAALLSLCAYSQNAPITPKMLTELRASKTVNASRPIVTIENNELVGMEKTEDNASVMGATLALQKAFNIRVSREFHPETSRDFRFAYSITANERLVDALNNLVTATGNKICWRLLDGRIIVTEIANEKERSDVQVGDRILDVNINGESIYDALLQLEAAYNEQHPDMPLVVTAPYYRAVQKSLEMKSERPDLFVLAGSDTLRNHILQLLNQFNQPFSDYSCAVYKVNTKNIALPWDGPELWYFHLRFAFPELDGGTESSSAEEYLWIFEEGDKRKERIEALFDRLKPGLLSYERNFQKDTLP